MRTERIPQDLPIENKVSPPPPPKKASIKKKVAYQVSLAYTLANRALDPDKYKWWDHIQGTNILLGAIPLKNRKHHTRIFENAVLHNGQKKLAVLTLLEPFEIKTKGPMSKPVAPKDWQALGVTQKIISASDFNPLSQQEIREAVGFLEEQDKQGIPTYVHCKAGRGRSATAVVCFLMKRYQCIAEDAKRVVAGCREQINLNERQWEAIKAYETSLKIGLPAKVK